MVGDFTQVFLSLCGILAAIVLVIFLIHLRFTKSGFYRALNAIPTADRHFLFGHALRFFVSREDWFKTMQKLTQPFIPITVIWVGYIPRVSLMRARFAERLLNSMKDLDKASEYKYITPWLGYGLLTSTGAKWHHRRKLITPTFHFRILEDFLRVINEQAEILVSILQEKHQDKEAFDICAYLSRCTLDVICETAMGKSVNVQINTGSEYFKAINSMAEIFVYRCMRPWLRPELLFRMTSYGKQQKKNLHILHSFTNEVIKERRKIHNDDMKMKTQLLTDDEAVQGQKRRLAFLDMLLNYQNDDRNFTDEDIREEVDTFMFEGHDTTSSALTWILFNLGRFPEVQKKVHEELDQIFGDSNRATTTNDLAELKYLERVIKESMRLFPPVPVYGRRLSEDLEICGYVIPAGVSVSINVYTLHRDPEFFPDPERFDPDRFLPENCTKRHPFAYIPFSAGPRNCIGQKFALMEEKVVISQILRQFKVIAIHKLEDFKIMGEIILRPDKGMWIKLLSRN